MTDLSHDSSIVGNGTEPERQLWCAVLLKMLDDAFGPVPHQRRTEYGSWWQSRAESREMLLGRVCRDFLMVCDLAGVDWRCVRAFARALEASEEASWQAVKDFVEAA